MSTKRFEARGCTALVTGANQGIGRGFVEVLLERGAKRVYATARRAETLAGLEALDAKRVVALELDVTDPDARRRVAAGARDLTLLVNNAGIPGSANAAERRMLAASSLGDARLVMETDLWAPVELCRLFTPLILANGGGAICNIVSIGALFCVPEYASYSLAKGAFGFATAGMRAELLHQPILVSGVYTGTVATRMSARNPNPNKSTPAEHAHEVLDAMARGQEDIYAGKGAPELRNQVRADPEAFDRLVAQRLHAAPLGGNQPGTDG